jgi:hypothetical protein
VPTYQYKSLETNQIGDITCDRNDKPAMDRTMREMGWRPYYGSIRFGTVMHSHYNATTGTVISDPRQFQRDLDQMSYKVEEQTGVKTNYVPVDLHDTDALGVTDEGLDATYDAGERVAGMGKKG